MKYTLRISKARGCYAQVNKEWFCADHSNGEMERVRMTKKPVALAGKASFLFNLLKLS